MKRVITLRWHQSPKYACLWPPPCSIFFSMRLHQNSMQQNCKSTFDKSLPTITNSHSVPLTPSHAYKQTAKNVSRFSEVKRSRKTPPCS